MTALEEAYVLSQNSENKNGMRGGISFCYVSRVKAY